MSRPVIRDGAGRIVVPSELMPQPPADTHAELLVRPGQRTVLRPSGKVFDAAAATRAERHAQSSE